MHEIKFCYDLRYPASITDLNHKYLISVYILRIRFFWHPDIGISIEPQNIPHQLRPILQSIDILA